MKRNVVVTALVAVLMAGFVLAYTALRPADAQPGMGAMGSSQSGGGMEGMGGMVAGDVPRVPPVTGFAEGEEVHFIHPEVSDPEVAKTLTGMMGSPVLVVPSLADASQEALANVYVFANGVKPEGARGPMGFQADVFDNPPGTEGYSPLRALNLVSWKDEGAARVLKSVGEVKQAQQKGEITIERKSVVVNMPFLTWPGGQR